MTALGAKRQRSVSRTENRIIGRETCSASAASISGVSLTPLPCAESAHAARDPIRLSRIEEVRREPSGASQIGDSCKH